MNQLSVNRAADALADWRIEILHCAERKISFGRCAYDSLGKRVLAGALDAGGELQQGIVVDARRRNHRDNRRLAFGQRAGLVDNQRFDPLHALQRFGVSDQQTVTAPRPMPTMIDIGVASPRGRDRQ